MNNHYVKQSLDSLPNYFKKAQKASLKSDHPNHKLGAVILQKNKIISIGANYVHKTHPITKKHDVSGFKTQHAEVTCILKIKNKDSLIGATVVVYRENKHGALSMARPCEMCRSILRHFGIKKMRYTTNGGWTEENL